MRVTHVLLLSLLLFISCKIHKNIANDKKTEQNFNNQGEQENYWARRLFEQDYKKQSYKKYIGNIQIIDSSQVKYGEQIITINCDSSLKPIFFNGILYPEVLGSGNIRITNLEEVSFLSHSVKIKRFRFLLWDGILANPSVYFFEMTNERATIKTTLPGFIKGAKLTFVKKGWVQT